MKRSVPCWPTWRNGAVLLALAATTSALSAEIIPADRRINWQGAAGIVGGIPNVTTIYTTFTSPPTFSALSSALASCPSNQVVQLGAWTNTYSSDVAITKSGVVMRGTTDALGRPLTKILFDSGRLMLRAPAVSTAAISVGCRFERGRQQGGHEPLHGGGALLGQSRGIVHPR